MARSREPRAETRLVPITALRPNPWNPNRMPTRLFEALKEQIRGGFVQPVLCRPAPSEGKEARYEILDGEHRWRAAQEVGLTQVPAVVVTDDDVAARLRTIAMNRIRGELDPLRTGSLLEQIAADPVDVQRLLGSADVELQRLVQLAHDASALEELRGADASETEEWIVLTFAVPESAHRVIVDALERVMGSEACDKSRALELLAADYLGKA